MENKILIIGNSGIKHHGTDGQTVKVRLYLDILRLEKIAFEFVDLENFKYRIPNVLLRIKKQLKVCSRVVLLTGQRGIKYLLPFIHKNNKRRIPIVLPMIGCNVLNKFLYKFSEQEMCDFFTFKKKVQPTKKDFNNINKIDLILPENEVVNNLLKFVFPDAKTKLLDNFRFFNKSDIQKKEDNGFLNLIYLSRVSQKKGILDLLSIVSELQEQGYKINLDIYGKTYFDDEERKTFANYILRENINYLGSFNPENSIRIISKYDLFVFPTNFRVEGTPGAVVESLLAGTPVLSSNYLNVLCLLTEGNDSLIFKQFDAESLKEKIIFAYKNRKILKEMSENCFDKSKRYTYEFNRKLFLKDVCGYEE